MPWLTGTALLHSLMLQQRRGVLKGWNVSLALTTGILAVLGTFLVRSGVLSSIHAFGASTLGVPFLGFILLLLVGSVWLVTSRAAVLAPTRANGPLLARPTVFVANNVLLVGLCFVVAWGTFFPLVSEAVTGTKSAVGPPWFDRYTVPLALGLVGLMGLGTLLRWGGQPPRRLAGALAAPLAVAVLAGGVALAAGALRSVTSWLLFTGAAFVFAASVRQIAVASLTRRRATGERLPAATVRVIARNRRRYGGYLAHVGMVAALVGVAGSSAFQRVHDVRLSPGQTTHVGAYDVSYRRATGDLSSEKISLGAVLDVSRGGRHVATLHPTRGYYPDLSLTAGPISRYFDGESTSEVGLKAGLRRDVWMAVQPDIGPLEKLMTDADKRFIAASPNVQALVVAGLVAHYEDRPPPAVFRMIVSPLVEWIWLGGALMIGGGLLAIWPRALPRLALARLRLPRPLRTVPS
jgi:cytochrome c-type biogenesis protein CcmF